MDTDLAVDTHTGASTRYINTASASRPRPARRAAPNQTVARRRHAARARRRTQLSHNSSRSGSARPATTRRLPGHTSRPTTSARFGATRRRNSRCGNQSVRLAGLEVSFIILAASTQRESAWRPRTRPFRLTYPNFLFPHRKQPDRSRRTRDNCPAGCDYVTNCQYASEVWDPVYNWTDRETGVTTLYNRTGEVLASA